MLTDYCALTNENIDIQSSKEKRFLTLSVSASFFLPSTYLFPSSFRYCCQLFLFTRFLSRSWKLLNLLSPTCVDLAHLTIMDLFKVTFRSLFFWTNSNSENCNWIKSLSTTFWECLIYDHFSLSAAQKSVNNCYRLQVEILSWQPVRKCSTRM